MRLSSSKFTSTQMARKHIWLRGQRRPPWLNTLTITPEKQILYFVIQKNTTNGYDYIVCSILQTNFGCLSIPQFSSSLKVKLMLGEWNRNGMHNCWNRWYLKLIRSQIGQSWWAANPEWSDGSIAWPVACCLGLSLVQKRLEISEYYVLGQSCED